MENDSLHTVSDDGPTILVVENVEWIRDGIVDLLKTSGYRAEPARDEQDAIVRARRERPDLILVSLGLAPLEAAATGLRIRECASADKAVPVVIFCAESVVGEGDEVVADSNLYVTHPDNFDQLRNLLGRLLRELPKTIKDEGNSSRTSDQTRP